MAQRKFANCLGEFQFEYIGDAKTDDEKCIGKCGFPTACITMETATLKCCFWAFSDQKSKSGFCLHLSLLEICLNACENYRLLVFSLPDESLQEFSSFLRNLEDQRELMVRTASQNLPQSPEKYLWVCMCVCLVDRPSVYVCEWGGACCVCTCRLQLHLFFPNA